MSDFFVRADVEQSINQFINILAQNAALDEFSTLRNGSLLLILNNMISNKIIYDQNTPFNKKYISEQFLNSLNAGHREKRAIDDIYTMALRFFLEEYLCNPNDNYRDYFSVRKFARENLMSFDETAQSQIEYALSEMGTSILKDVLMSDDFRSLRAMKDVIDTTQTISKKLNDDLKEREKKVEQLKETLSEHEVAFNFVGLYSGFESLGKQKQKQLNWAKGILFSLGILLPLIIIFESLQINSISDSPNTLHTLISLIPSVSLALIIIYYFRVALTNFNSIRGQIMQIELRKSLCQFIQSYAKYSSEMKEKDAGLLDKFEDVIFSNIMPSEDKIPSTFDGIDKLASLISSLKTK